MIIINFFLALFSFGSFIVSMFDSSIERGFIPLFFGLLVYFFLNIVAISTEEDL